MRGFIIGVLLGILFSSFPVIAQDAGVQDKMITTMEQQIGIMYGKITLLQLANTQAQTNLNACQEKLSALKKGKK